MEIEITSIIIGIVALSTFFIPIGLYQFSQKQIIKKARKSFDAAAEKTGLHINQMEIIRNGVAIGIDLQQQIVLHVRNGIETLTDIKNVSGCKLFKHQRKDMMGHDNSSFIQQMGILITFHKSQHKDLKLLFFEGKEGSTFGDEGVIIHRWVKNINSALKTNGHVVIQ